MCTLRYTFSGDCSGRPYSRNNPFSGVKDNSCVIFDGLDIVFASETERWTKLRHDCIKPIMALEKFISKSRILDENLLEEIVAGRNGLTHHESHIYECFYQSGFKESAILVNDGRGEDECLTLAYMEEGREPIILKKFPKEESMCGLYHLASRIIHKTEHAEGKMMGLSAYGTNNGRKYIFFDEQTESLYADIEHVRRDLYRIFDEKLDCDWDVMEAKDVAFTIQMNFEDAIVGIIKHFKQILEEKGIQTDNLCMSGGGILNCPANSRIVELGLFKHYYASPQPSDGCAESIGRAFRVFEHEGIHLTSKKLESAYLGINYTIDEFKWQKQWLDDPYSTICEDLNEGNVMAWYQGGAEYGPRALGHRSFLADPSSETMLDSLNKIKGRELWRPLAPIVPEELFTRIFEVENTDMCEFMLRTLKIKEKWRSRLHAVCHVDGTTRPQLLKRTVNPQLYDLLMFWFERTHIPCLVNTSLNINGFPIVETPYDLRCLQEEISYLTDVPSVKFLFVDDNNFYNLPAKLSYFEDTWH